MSLRVRCYYNLHKHCISVQHKGKVIDHTYYIVLENVKFIVQPAGRRRVLREKRKNVHAFVEGDVIEKAAGDDWKRVSYSPYADDHFYFSETRERVTTADVAVIDDKMVWTLGAK